MHAFYYKYRCESAVFLSFLLALQAGNDLLVAPAGRRAGVGRALMEAAENFARDDGAAEILLETADDNMIAQALFESRGWRLEVAERHYPLTL